MRAQQSIELTCQLSTVCVPFGGAFIVAARSAPTIHFALVMYVRCSYEQDDFPPLLTVPILFLKKKGDGTCDQSVWSGTVNGESHLIGEICLFDEETHFTIVFECHEDNLTDCCISLVVK